MSSARFTLTDEDGSVTFGTEYISNWDELEISLTRSDSQRGRVREVSNVFSFVGIIRKRIIALYDTYNTNAYIELLIEIGNDNKEEFSYSDLGNGYAIKADFNNISITETKVEISFSDSDFQEKLETYGGEDIEITLGTTVYDSDETLDADYSSMLKTIYMHDRLIQLNSQLTDDSVISKSYDDISTKIMYVPGLVADYNSDSDNVQETTAALVTDFDDLYSDNYLLLNVEEDNTFDISVSGSIRSTQNPFFLDIRIYVVDEDGDRQTSFESISATVEEDGDYYNFIFDGTFEDVELAEGESLIFCFLGSTWGGIDSLRIGAYDDQALVVSVTSISSSAIATESDSEVISQEFINKTLTEDYNHAVYIPTFTYSDVNDSEIAETVGLITNADLDDIIDTSYLIYKSSRDEVLSLYLHGTLTSSNNSPSLKIVVFDEDLDVYETVTQGLTATVRDDGNYDITIDYDLGYLEVDEDYSLLVYIQLSSADSGDIVYAGANIDDSQTLTLEITSTYDKSDTTANCILPHDFFNLYIEMMTGKKDSFYSEYFGREELGYDEDGEGAYIAILDGYMIRNATLDDYPLTTNFEDMLDDFIKLKNLVGRVEYRGGAEVYRIEKYTDLFGLKNKVVDIGELFSDVTRAPNADLTWSSISVGADDSGLDETYYDLNYVNGTCTFTTPLSGADNELDLVTKAQIEAYLIEDVRRDQWSENSDTSNSNDDNIFLIDATPVTGKTYDLVAIKDEDFEYVTGINNPETAYNLNFAPHITLIKQWGIVVAGCLQKELTESLVLTDAAVDSSMVTKYTTDDYEIDHNENVSISLFPTPRIINEIITVDDTKEIKSQYDIIEDNPNALMKITFKDVDFYGFIDTHDYKPLKKSATFELLKANR